MQKIKNTLSGNISRRLTDLFFILFLVAFIMFLFGNVSHAFEMFYRTF